MAIVFISPKRKQKTLFFSLIAVISLFLIIIVLKIFLIKPKSIPPELVFKPPRIDINFKILKSEQVKNLEVFEGIKKKFNYRGRAETGEIQSGEIITVSQEKALEILEKRGLSQIELEEVEIELGRENPFIIYEGFIQEGELQE